MQYKVGDKVKIKGSLKGGREYDDLYFNPYMEEYRGKTAKVSEITPQERYKLDISGDWVCNDAMLEPVTGQPFKVGDKVKVLAKRRSWSGSSDHVSHSCIGKLGVIDEVDSEQAILDTVEGVYMGIFLLEELEKVEIKKEETSICGNHTDRVHHLPVRIEHSSYNPFFSLRADRYFTIGKPKRKQKGGGVMTQLSKLAKKLLDTDTKALVKAGVLDNELEVTEEGADFVLTFLVDKNKAELAKEARKLLREQKKDEDEE